MSYTGSEATRLDVYRGESLQQQRQATLRTVAGEGADARARAGVTSEFLAKYKAFLVVVAIVGALCVARVGTFALAAGIMADNATMRTQIEESTTLANQLRIQRSVLSSTSRIDRIATQTYGMVAADSAEQMTAGAASAAAEQQAAEQAADEVADTTSEQASDEAADAASFAKSSDEVAEDISQAEITQGDGSSAGANAADVDSIS